MTEEEAFWTFTRIIESLMPPDYYANMLGASVDMKVVTELVASKMPALFAHFQATGFMVEMSCL